MQTNLLRAYTITIRFHGPNEGKVTLAQLSGSGNIEFENVAEYRVQEIKMIGDDLSKGLENYQKSKTLNNLRELVIEGYRAYTTFLTKITDDHARTWLKGIIKDRKNYNSPIIEMTTVEEVTIPFNLFYVEDPRKIDWENHDYSKIIDGFIGMHFPLSKRYQRKRRRLLNSMMALCRKDDKPLILHSIDNAISGAKSEEQNWRQLNGDVVTPKTKEKIVENWTNEQRPPHLVHCSCHLKEDKKGRRYISCCDSESIYINDLLNHPLNFPPFVFLNSCNGGVISPDHRDNFVVDLFPTVASGFIATLCPISDDLAVDVAGKFYCYFAGGAGVLESLHQSIRDVASRGELGALSYVLWESYPYLVLRA